MTKTTADFIFVHGFLGLSSDWLDIQNHLRLKHRQSFLSINLWEKAQAGASFNALAEQISERCHERTLVVGYSLGGRILMHLPPSRLRDIAGMVLISSHFGLSSASEKEERLKNDKVWAERFRRDDWSTLMNDWNHQPVFANAADRPNRFEKNYDRQLLAQVLEACSLGVQKDNILNPNIPFEKTLYIYGQDDVKYADSIKKWKTQQPKIHVKAVPGGHYPLVNSSFYVAEHIHTFYKNLMIS